MRPNRGFIKYAFYADKRHLDELRLLASYEDRTVSDLIREIISNFLHDDKSMISEELRKKERQYEE